MLLKSSLKKNGFLYLSSCIFERLSSNLRCVSLNAQTQVKGPVEQYNPYNYDESFAQEYGGYGEGGAVAGPRTIMPPRGVVERELKIPTLVRDVPRPLSPPRGNPRGYPRAASYERELPPSLMGVAQPVRGPG